MNLALSDFIAQLRTANRLLQDQQRIVSQAERAMADSIAKEIVKEVRRQL